LQRRVLAVNISLESVPGICDACAMKVKRRLRTREELLALEEKYPCVLGNPLSLGAAHFRQANRRNAQRPARKGNGPFPRRTRRPVAA
jgi:hypothetical protein